MKNSVSHKSTSKFQCDTRLSCGKDSYTKGGQKISYNQVEKVIKEKSEENQKDTDSV